METGIVAGAIGGRYRIDGLLGQGGMARVFDGFDERLERRVAVKILRPETLALPGMRKRFQQEARLAARLTHPNIVAVLDYGEDHSSSYLVMERLPGTTLRDEIATGPLTADRVTVVMTETLAALAAAHKFGVVHRDIKPSNILLQEDGHTKLTDFGIAKSFDIDDRGGTDDMTLTGVVLGTPGYLPPERRAGLPATTQSDLYSLGAVMVEALTGRRFDPGAGAPEHLSSPFRDLAMGALAAEPRDRFTSASEMLLMLTGRPGATAPRLPTTIPMAATTAAPTTFPAPLGTAILSPPPAVRASAGHSRRWRRRAVLAAAMVAAIAALFLLLESGTRPTGPAGSASSHQAVRVRPHTDPQGAAIKAIAASLARGGQPGDQAMANALQATAAQPPGVRRQSSAQQALSLGQALSAVGGITPGQYQDVVSVLQPTGATVPTSTTTTTAPTDPGLTTSGDGHGKAHGQGNSQGD